MADPLFPAALLVQVDQDRERWMLFIHGRFGAAVTFRTTAPFEWEAVRDGLVVGTWRAVFTVAKADMHWTPA